MFDRPIMHVEADIELPIDTEELRAYRRELDVIHGEFSEVLSRLHVVEQRQTTLREDMAGNDKAYDESTTRRLNHVVVSVGDRLKEHDKRLASVDSNQARHERRIGKLIEWLRNRFGAAVLRGED